MAHLIVFGRMAERALSSIEEMDLDYDYYPHPSPVTRDSAFRKHFSDETISGKTVSQNYLAQLTSRLPKNDDFPH
ncbi:MAG: hypothetical protein Q9M48_13610 [Rhodobacterales bacterium]|nr:hypothetical protein [Rhodobacterales bacterium]